MSASEATTPSLMDELAGASSEAVSLVDGLVLDSTRALFESYGVELHRDGSSLAETLPAVQLVCSIGFSSPELSGSLLLAVPDPVLAQTLPTPGANLADWSGELGNQLLGRLKNQLLNYDVAINLALPVVVSGGELSLPARARGLMRHFSFVSEPGRVFIRMAIELSPSAELVRRTGEGETVGMDEGELIFF